MSSRAIRHAGFSGAVEAVESEQRIYYWVAACEVYEVGFDEPLICEFLPFDFSNFKVEKYLLT